MGEFDVAQQEKNYSYVCISGQNNAAWLCWCSRDKMHDVRVIVQFENEKDVHEEGDTCESTDSCEFTTTDADWTKEELEAHRQRVKVKCRNWRMRRCMKKKKHLDAIQIAARQKERAKALKIEEEQFQKWLANPDPNKSTWLPL